MRLSIEDWAIGIAEQAAQRSTCTRAKVGAVLMFGNDLLSVGYNGSMPSAPHCADAGCMISRGGSCVRCRHAELNAVIRSKIGAFHMTRHGELWLACTHTPCPGCAHLLSSFMIRRVIYKTAYNFEGWSDESILEATGIKSSLHSPETRWKL